MFKYLRPTVLEAVGEEVLEEVEVLEEEAMEEMVEEETEEVMEEVVEVVDEVAEVVGAVVVVDLRFIAFTSLNLQSTYPQHQFMSPQHPYTLLLLLFT